MSKLTQWLKKEEKKLFPVVLYFMFSFNLVHFAQTLVRPSEYIRFTSYMGATIAALVAGKIILVTESLPFINAFPRKPAIWNIIWRFFIYSIVVIAVQLLDPLVRIWLETGHIMPAIALIKTYLWHTTFWGVQIYELCFFLVYIVFSEFAKVVGLKKTRKIFFG